MDQKNTAMQLNRVQTLKAMQTLIIALGGVKAYTAWLGAMPDNAELSIGGGVEHATLMAVASDESTYAKVVRAFKDIMPAVFEAM